MGSLPIPPDETGKEKVIDSLVTNVEAMIKADRKITALKQLQVIRIFYSNSCNVKDTHTHTATSVIILYSFIFICRDIYGELGMKIMNCRELFLRMFPKFLRIGMLMASR